ncbi:MAG TPA: hypothetical protein VN493_31095 [Thermoanaerobaculia bacterium]|nr:hypothetical protein [Thermoanaerobaculia bacterium]
MKSERVRNGLLFVIAVCLVLIVLRLYSVDLVKEAEAQGGTVSPTYLYACDVGENCTRPQAWSPVRLDEHGRLVVE